MLPRKDSCFTKTTKYTKNKYQNKKICYRVDITEISTNIWSINNQKKTYFLSEYPIKKEFFNPKKAINFTYSGANNPQNGNKDKVNPISAFEKSI